MQTRFQAVYLAIILVAASGAEAANLYFMADPWLRLGVGLLLLVPIVWAGSLLGIVEQALALLALPSPPRRYIRLRTLTKALLSEVCRLNWTAVDGKTGVRGHDETTALLDATEDRMKKLLGQMRGAAGVEAAGPQEGLGAEDRPPTSAP